MTGPAVGKILIVEDDSGLAHLQATRLGRLGHSVTKVTDAEGALEICRNEQFDLYILDYALGGELTGLALYQILRERGATAPAILVTGFEDPKIIVESIRAGVRDFIPKNAEVLDSLPLAAERVLNHIRIERELFAANVIREQQEQMQSAFEAAHLAYWSWDLRTGKRQWYGFHEEIFGMQPDQSAGAYDGFMPSVVAEDAAGLAAVTDESKRSKQPMEHEFRIRRPDGSMRWVLARGRFYYGPDESPSRMAGVIFDVTERKFSEARLDQSNSQIQALNDRLNLSISETHHRVKNSLQGVISLVNLQVRDKQTLSQDDVKKIISHVQGVANLHDVLSESSKLDGDTTTVSLEVLFEKLLAYLTRNYGGRMIDSELADCVVTAKQGATLSVVLNELVSNALKHGTGPILICVKNHGNHGSLSVQNEGSCFPEDFRPEKTSRTGLLLLKMLCKTDLQSEPSFENIQPNRARVTVTFPLHNSASAPR